MYLSVEMYSVKKVSKQWDRVSQAARLSWWPGLLGHPVYLLREARLSSRSRCNNLGFPEPANHQQTISKPSANHQQTINKPSANHQQTINKPWANHHANKKRDFSLHRAPFYMRPINKVSAEYTVQFWKIREQSL